MCHVLLQYFIPFFLFFAGRKIPTGQLTINGRKIYQRKQKVLNAISKPKTHVLMCSPVENGGYEFVLDKEGKVRFSLSAMKKYWPNWVVEMNEAQMIMCACETCQIMKY